MTDTPASTDAPSGLALLEAIRDGRVPPPAMAVTLGFALDDLDVGRATFRGTPGPAHLNPMGGVHGGWYGTILDSALGCAVMSALPAGVGYTTLEYKVNLTRAIPPGTEVLCAAALDHLGRRTAVASGTIRGRADGKLYATGTATCLILGG